MKLLQSNIQAKHSSPMPCYLEDINFKISSKNRTICSRRAYTFFRSSAIGSTETAYKTGVNPKLSDIRGKFTFNT